MKGGRPGDPVSPESRAWLRQVRANVKEQLFGPPAVSAVDRSTTEPLTPSEPDVPEAERPALSTVAPGPAADDASDQPARIGRFVVIKRIGEGGMGMVYAAYDDALDRKVAVKLLHPQGSSGTDGRARLIREAQALARLSHPSVIHVYEVGTWQEQVYVAMEFVDGGTLGHWQQQEGRAWREILEAYVAAGRGLAAAHAAGIVHRDFKAANVLVRSDGAVRVVDFGLARQELESGASVSSPRPFPPELSGPSLSLVEGQTAAAASASAPLTRTGVIMGTPAYMAPEQHLGQRADTRCDQFSYCVSLYEALYGFRPFVGSTLPELRRNVLAGRLEQPPRYNDIPPRIFRVLERGLQVHPDERYPAMEPLLDDLVRDPRVTVRRLLYALAAALAVLLVVAQWWSEREEREARAEGEQLRAQFERARVLNAEDELRRTQTRTVSEKWDDLVLAYAREALDDDPTTALAALKHITPGNTDWLPAARTIAADAMQRGVVHRRLDPGLGRIEQLAFTDDGEALLMAGNGLVRWDLESDERRRLEGSELAMRVVSVARDGRRVVGLGADGEVYQWEYAPGDDNVTRRRLGGTKGPILAVAVSPDGERIATGSSQGLVRLWQWNGARLRPLRGHEGSIRALEFSPDGSTLASAGSDREIRMWFLERQTHVTLQHGPGIRGVLFDGDGDFLWSTADDGRVRRWSASAGIPQAAGELEDVTLLARTRDGDTTLVCHRARELVLRGDGDPQPMRGMSAIITSIALSPDGAWAAAATGDDRIHLWRLTGMGGDDTQPDGSRVSATPGAVTALAFSRAGSLLASASRQGVVQLWSENGDERGTLGQHDRTILDLGFSAPGHELAAYDEDGQLIVWSVADRDQPPLYLGDQYSRGTMAWAWSPDGNWLAAPSCEGSQRCTLVLYPLSGGDPVELPLTDSPATALRFSPSGARLLSDHPTGSWLWKLDEGRGLPLEWPDGEQPDRRLAFAFVRGGVRMATADVLHDQEARVVSTTLRAWHIGQRSGDIHLLFEAANLRDLRVDKDGRTLLLRTRDDHSLLWRLAGDRFRLLPSIGPPIDQLIVSPDARALLLRPQTERGSEPDSIWVDVDSGQMRRFSRRHEPMAWSTRGTVVDASYQGLRIWRDPTPSEVGAFLRWLDDATDAEIEPTQIR